MRRFSVFTAGDTYDVIDVQADHVCYNGSNNVLVFIVEGKGSIAWFNLSQIVGVTEDVVEE